MFTLNQITLIGFTGSEAEVHYTQNGTVVAVVSSRPKSPGRTPTANGRAGPTGTG